MYTHRLQLEKASQLYLEYLDQKVAFKYSLKTFSITKFLEQLQKLEAIYRRFSALADEAKEDDNPHLITISLIGKEVESEIGKLSDKIQKSLLDFN